MIISSKTKQVLIIIYVIFLLIGFLFVRSVLKNRKIEVDQAPAKEKIIQPKEVTVYLTVNLPQKSPQTYRKKLKNIDTVMELLNKVKDDTGLTFEKTYYTYGLELDTIDNIKAPDGYKWKIFQESTDITNKLEELTLQDKKSYELKLVKIN